MSRKLAVASLLYSLDYLPGIFTLGHQINKFLRVRSNSDNIETCLLVTESLYKNELTVDTKNALHTLYHKIILINPLMENDSIMSKNNENLDMLDRPELAFTLIKIKLWNQVMYDQILYLDADTLPMSTDLFNLFDKYEDQNCLQVAASPDIGWPDMFNSGVMLLTPNEDLYHKLHIFTIDHVSIDGADQGILNQFFNQNCNCNDGRQWQILPFLYNVTTPNTGYQCPPAMKYFGKDIKLIHFIGNKKPWKVTLEITSENSNYAKEWYNVYEEYITDRTLDQGLIDPRAKEEKPYHNDILEQFENNYQEQIDNNQYYNEMQPPQENYEDMPQPELNVNYQEEQQHQKEEYHNYVEQPQESHPPAEPEKIDLPLQFRDWLTIFIKKEEAPVPIRQDNNNALVSEVSYNNGDFSKNGIDREPKPAPRLPRVYERTSVDVERQFSETGIYNTFDHQDQESIISEDEDEEKHADEAKGVTKPIEQSKPEPKPVYVPNYSFDWEKTGYQNKVERIFPNDIFEYEVENDDDGEEDYDNIDIDKQLETANLRRAVEEREEDEEEEEEEDIQESEMISEDEKDEDVEEEKLSDLKQRQNRSSDIYGITEVLDDDNGSTNPYASKPPVQRQFLDYDTPIFQQIIPEEPSDYAEDYGDE
ncbi:hypothetical protein C6P45_000190 [Maudiozyma exigua]|uniref:glycogenin glucosyltransferase n=1 Tax=Maudiozyma exigua TaxID=34358 RepID=A0A9P6W7E1_MAUEX|nr:hypothetical protein C6P45_000190 [Kazachstania exigua]